jgi:hypothetical protein
LSKSSFTNRLKKRREKPISNYHCQREMPESRRHIPDTTRCPGPYRWADRIEKADRASQNRKKADRQKLGGALKSVNFTGEAEVKAGADCVRISDGKIQELEAQFREQAPGIGQRLGKGSGSL